MKAFLTAISASGLLLATTATTVAMASPSHPEKLVCNEVATLELNEQTGQATVGPIQTVSVTMTETESKVVRVENLPEGRSFTMNYQNVFDPNPQLDGEVFYAPKETGDGTIQEICGDDSFNTLIGLSKLNKNYCAKCQ